MYVPSPCGEWVTKLTPGWPGVCPHGKAEVQESFAANIGAADIEAWPL